MLIYFGIACIHCANYKSALPLPRVVLSKFLVHFFNPVQYVHICPRWYFCMFILAAGFFYNECESIFMRFIS